MSFPSSFGPYRVERELGSGGMGTVYAAKHAATGADVAIKVLHPQFQRDGVIRERFLREARAASALKSPHVAKLLAVAADAHGTPYLVLERLHGCDLEQLLESGGAVSEDTAIDYVMQACDALAEAHSLGIVHRDLKLENLFLAHATIRVLDFGISKSALEPRQLTARGEALGTPHYMAPEQLKSARDATARTDIWALGVVLYRLLTKALPFDGANTVELALEIQRREPMPLEQLRPRISREMSAIVRRCLTKDPHGRFANATELRRALEDVRERTRANSRLAFAATVQALPNAKPARVSNVSPTRHRRGYTLLVAAVFASLIGILALTQRASAAPSDDDRAVVTHPEPEPAATQLLGARLGAEPSTRGGAEPSARGGAEPSAHGGAEPSGAVSRAPGRAASKPKK